MKKRTIITSSTLFRKMITVSLLLITWAEVAAQTPGAVVWKEIDGVSIPIPPKVHPRLYLREQHIPDLKARMSDPGLKEVWRDLHKMQEEWKPQDIPAKKDFRYYFNQKGVVVTAQLKALDYLVSKDKKKGREAIEIMVDTLQKVNLPDHGGDIARAWGLMLTNGAMIYDWCYPLLTVKEKEIFVKEFLRIAGHLECGYPPVKRSAITDHTSEWMIARDLLSVAVAIYDEYPEMYHLTAGRYFREHVTARNWFYPAHNYIQGTSYFNVRFGCDLFPLWIFDRMGAGNIYHPSQQFVLYDIIYRRRPDGQVLPSGDEGYTRARRKGYPLPMLLAGSYYKDEYLNYEFLQSPRMEAHCKIFDFLWRDTKLGTQTPENLPLTRYSESPFGLMLARTGWDEESVIAEMKINEYTFTNHQHLDAGVFQIYYKGPLAIDAGTYQGTSGGYNSPHNKNFFKRTIAHNGLLVYDPDEQFLCDGYGGADKTDLAANDGGQRMPGKNWGAVQTLTELLNTNFKTGEILANDFGPDQHAPNYSYLKGDITLAYSKKVKEVKRSFVFLNLKNKEIPAAFIVFDKVVSADPSFKKTWLLHSIEEPQVEGNRTTIRRTKNGDSGMLVNTTLLPALGNATIETVGGPGKEFWVAGMNYPNVPTGDEANERGEWRVEISPKSAKAEDYYLNVMQIASNKQKELHRVSGIEGKEVVGARLANRVVTFSRNSNTLTHPFLLSVEGEGRLQFLITDLLPGTWQVKKDGKVYLPAVKVSTESGTLYFEGTAGEYQFLR